MAPLRRGLLAGAFGTLVLDAVTYLDMALTGRPASSAPAETVQGTLEAAGLRLPGDPARREAYGALGGIATGLGVGVLASLTRAAGVRLPASLGAVATGAVAMAATDAPMTALGVSDPRDWSSTDWVRDVGPHLAYGIGVRWAMDHLDRREVTAVAEVETPTTRPSRLGLAVRAAAIGVATGARNSLAIGGPVLTGRPGLPSVVAAGLVTTELVVDKVPGIPTRLQPGPLLTRGIGGSLAAAALVRRDEDGAAAVTGAVVIGAAGALVGSLAGAAWRELAAERGWTWQAGLAEDAVAIALTVGACR